MLAVLPTGAGKSICYQIPALISENFSIVISPLIALMKDQVDSLNSKKEVAGFINSTMSSLEAEEVLNKIALGSIKLLYLAPEKIDNLKFADRIKNLSPKYLFIDEAHCISEWGHNFRPSYLKIKDFIKHLGIKKVSAFTATATPEVREDIILQLGYKDEKVFVRGFERENLNLRVLQIKKKKEKCLELTTKISGPAIIYSSSRRKTEEAAEFLTLKRIKCNYYHAGLSAPERRRVQEEFLNGETEIISATNAFGMGIDKSNISLIIHFNTPGSIESYYQEIGRAGRDGKESYCFLLHDDSDIAIQNFFISSSHPSREIIQNIYKAICDHNRIAVGSITEKELIVDREYISKYIGTELSPGLLHSSLKYLESSGYIHKISEYDKRDTLQILFSKDKLRQFIQNSSFHELSNVLVLLLREFGSSIFTTQVKISSANLASEIMLQEQILIESLQILDNMGIVSYNPALSNETVKLAVPRTDASELNLNYKLINESYLNSQRKLDRMLEFVHTNECRFKYILNYFGEEVNDYRCGKCDNCTSAGKLNDSSVIYLSEMIIETLEEAGDEIPDTFLIKILRGEKIKQSASIFKHFGACKNFSTSEIRGVIASLISYLKVTKSPGKRNYLSVTNELKASSSIREIESKPIPENKKSNEELYLYNQLREARKKAAERFVQTGYIICPDNILREIASKKPRTKSDLFSISGFNSRMFNKVGQDFLDIINDYKPEKILTQHKIISDDLPPNIIETKKLLERKYSLKEIAQTRKLSEAVISMQVETIIEYKPSTDISSLIKKELLELIFKEAEKGFDNLKELKERLPSKINYPEIRIGVAKYRASSRSLS